MSAPNLIIIGGKPYSGKSTLAKRLAEVESPTPIRLLSMGERLRAIGAGEVSSQYYEILSKNTDALKHHMAVPNEVPLGIFEEFVKEQPTGLIILDGFPRYPDRVHGFNEAVQRLNAKVIGICRIDIDDAEVFERSKKRDQRYADVPEDKAFVEKRLDDYRQNILPTLDALCKDYSLHIIDGTQPLETKLAKLKEICNL